MLGLNRHGAISILLERVANFQKTSSTDEQRHGRLLFPPVPISLWKYLRTSVVLM